MISPVIVTSCKDDDDNKVEYSLDGTWVSENTEFIISGASGKFSKIKSGLWVNALENGFIEQNASRIKNITKNGENEWSCSFLAVCHILETTTVTSVFWSDDCNLFLSDDGETLTIENLLQVSCSDPKQGTKLATSTYTRKK